jgi:glycosyltransferase involved in cell wall biosynthesis
MFEDKQLKISIITPVFNGASYLEDTILSVINQGYPNLEYIIIDGGSTDGSVDIIKKHEKHLTYWVSEPDKGLYHAVQKGFEKSTGDIMAWINSDDMYHKGAFSIVSELFTQFPQIEWMMGIPSTYDEKGRTIMVDGYRQWCKANYHLGQYEWIQQESVFWKRSLWEKSGSKMDTSLKLAGDFELWMRFFRHAELYTLQALLAGFRVRRANQLSLEQMGAYRREVEKVIQEELRLLPSDYIAKITSVSNFYKELALKKHRISRSLFFRMNYERIRSFEDTLFVYPERIEFDRFKQQFVINNRITETNKVTNNIS